MRFADIEGNSRLKEALAGMADSGRIPQAILMHEDDGGDGLALALAFFQYLCCCGRTGGDSCGECPSCRKISRLVFSDLHFVFPVNSGKIPASQKPTSEAYMPYWRELVLSSPSFTEGELYEALGLEGKAGNIAAAEAQRILSKLSFYPVEDLYTAVIVYLPEKMGQETANKLLKIVEEPPARTIFIMITHSPENVLQTISSRCQMLRVLPSPRAGEDAVQGELGELFTSLFDSVLRRDLLSALAAGETAAALGAEKRKAFCLFLSAQLRKMFMIREGLSEISGCTESERAALERYAGALRADFFPRCLQWADGSAALLQRNVNPKIVFCDLVNRIFSGSM